MTRKSRTHWLWLLFPVWVSVANPQEIYFTNKTVSFTNLEGTLFSKVQMVRGDWDGVIWRDGVSGGRVCYTNLHPAWLELWGIPTNRIEIARDRAGQRAAAYARDRAQRCLQAELDTVAAARARARESASASAKDFAEKKRVEAGAISTLEKEIEDARILLRRAEAVARDYNRANRYNRLAPRIFVKDTERAAVDEAEKRLKRMKAEFTLKYGHAFRDNSVAWP